MKIMTERISRQELPKGFMDGLFRTERYLHQSGLDVKMLELVKYRVSQINCCAYCLDMHHKEAISMGESELRLHSLVAWREAPFYNAQERAVLAFAEALTMIGSGHFDTNVYDELAHFFSKEEISGLTLAIAQTNAWNRINVAFRTVPGHYETQRQEA